MRTKLLSFFIKTTLLLFVLSFNPVNAQVLKSIVYDFDGLDIGETSLPEGEFGSGDLSYQVAANPLAPSDMLGDRVLKLDLNWAAGTGNFGRGISRYVEFSPTQDRLNFYFYNPSSNNQNAIIDVKIADDDNQSEAFEGGSDDVWIKSITVPGSAGWQLYSFALSDFTDGNTQGNGVFDIAFTQNKGMLLSVEFKFSKESPSSPAATFYLDMINFSDGAMPKGSSDFDLPGKDPSDFCVLGAFTNELPFEYDKTPGNFEPLFPSVAGKKIRFVNTFIHWSYNASTVPSSMPGAAAQNLINAGYVPILTWEPLFAGYTRLDPVQPRLDNIINGDYNSYIDAFADQVKALSGTIIIRFMHEFEGDWYPWSLVHNNQDPNKYITAFRKVVDRFRARGANNVQWMWCVNSDYAPYKSYNWIVNCYPGDSYVDIVATDIYNNHFPVNFPWWRSFRWQVTESYYYLTKYFPQKPLYICELGCRERFSTENTASESKGAWYARMDKELQSNYHKARALIFFNASPDQNWVVNSSPGALQSLTDNVWNDSYYFNAAYPPMAVSDYENTTGALIFPNPTNGMLYFNFTGSSEKLVVRITSAEGKVVYNETFNSSESFPRQLDVSGLAPGVYIVEFKQNSYSKVPGAKRMNKLVIR
jgi:hypothetical protein